MLVILLSFIVVSCLVASCVGYLVLITVFQMRNKRVNIKSLSFLIQYFLSKQTYHKGSSFYKFYIYATLSFPWDNLLWDFYDFCSRHEYFFKINPFLHKQDLQKDPMNRVGWVKLLARELKNACNKDDAIAHGSSVLDAFESSIHAIAIIGVNQVVLSFSSLVDGRNGERSEGC